MNKKGVWGKVLAADLASLLALASPLGSLGEVRAEEAGTSIANAGFESDIWGDSAGWSTNVSNWDNTSVQWKQYGSDSAPDGGEESYVNFWSGDQWTTLNLTQNISLKAGTYDFTVSGMGDNAAYMIILGDAEGDQSATTGWNSWGSATLKYTAEEDQDSVELKISAWTSEADGYVELDNVTVTYTAPEEIAEPEPTEPEEQETDDEKSSFTLYYQYTGDSTPLYIDIWNHAGLEFGESAKTDSTFGWSYKQAELARVENDAEWYYVDFAIISDDSDGFDIYAGSSDNKLSRYDTQWNNTEIYAKLISGDSDVYCIDEEGTLYTSTEEAGIGQKSEDTETEDVIREFSFDTTPVSGSPVDSDIYVDKVSGMMNDFITGFDVSSYLSLKNSGATFKDYDGNVLSDAGFFSLLKSAGVNYIRVRTWVDPYDANGNTYGGGVCDMATSTKIAKLASDAGMKVLVDFHYSDFWTDPGKQNAPKSWAGLTLEEKAETLQKYTEDSLKTMLDAGVNVGMVQVGNETTTGFCGETNMTNMCTLFSAGSKGIRNIEEEYDRQILIAIHLTNPDSIDFSNYASKLEANGVIYDVFATSYYPYWHGSLSNLYSKLNAVAEKYDKYVMVAETSYARTLLDGDGHENTESESKLSSDTFPYVISEQGQALHIRNVISTVASIPDNKGIGVFWWEPAWIPVQVYDKDSSDAATVLAENKAIWEKYGSGWATSAAAGYDKNVGTWYGGSAVDNESVFDFDGTALDILKVYNMVRFGTTADDYIVEVKDTEVEYTIDDDTTADDLILPETVSAVFASGDTASAKVTWNEKDINEAVKSGTGEYPIEGTASYGDDTYSVICTLKLIGKNYVINPGFEDPDMSMWEVTDSDGNEYKIIGRQNDSSNVLTGSYALKFWDSSPISYIVNQVIKLDAGTYTAGTNFEGGDAGDEYTHYFFIKVGDGDEQTSDMEFQGWRVWQTPKLQFTVEEDGTEVTIGVVAENLASGAWGAYDDFYIYKDKEEVSYDIVTGDGAEYELGEEGNLTFIADGPYVKFVSVEVDGELVDSSNYTVRKGSTVITFKSSFLKTLAEGDHTITINYTDGKAEGTFSVIAPAPDPTPAVNPDPTPAVNPNPTPEKQEDTKITIQDDKKDDVKKDTNAKTADTADIGLVGLLMLGSFAGVILTLEKKRKTK